MSRPVNAGALPQLRKPDVGKDFPSLVTSPGHRPCPAHLRRWLLWIAPSLVCAITVGCAGPRAELGEVSATLERHSGRTLKESKPGEITLPPGVSLEDGLSEDEASSIALWNNALFQETLTDLGLSRADLTQAGMLPNPTFSMLIPVGAKPLELTAKYPLEVLWLRPSRVAAAKLDYERTAERLVQSGLDLIRDVRLAHAEATLANQQVKFAEETSVLNRRIAELSEARLRAGEASELETGNARSDALQAREQAAKLRTDARIASERLRHLLGLGLEQWTDRLTDTPAQLPAGDDVNQYLTNAFMARPDLRAAELGLAAAGKRIGLARAETFTFAAGINAKEIGSGASKEFLSGPTVDFPVPILNQNQGGVSLARARFEKSARQYYTVRDRIVLEVRESHARLAQARESSTRWREQILPPLEESVRQAEKAYSGGNVSYLFVLETNRKLYDARLKEATAAAELRRATAELERSIGQRLDTAARNPLTHGNETH